jgi:dihydropyrimidinase
VTSVKLYLAYPDRLMVDDDTLARALAAGRATGVLVCVHAESGLEAVRLTDEALARDETGPAGLPRARPPWIEADAIRRAAALAARADAPLYVVHLSSADGLEAVRESRGLGARVLAETCPQYLELTADRLRSGTDDAQDHCCTPPLREDVDREALWSALGHGELQAISTDHCPFTRADRRAGVRRRAGGWKDFTEIPGGLPGVETRVALAYQGVVEGRFDPPRWVDLVATTPARLFGLDPRKGDLAPGLDADLVVFDPTATKRLDAAALHMRTDHSPYEGRTLTGWPALTLCRGRPVARDGEPVGDRPLGRFVPRRPRP